MKNSRYIIIILLLVLIQVAFFGQSMKIKGTVSGYSYNPKNGLFSKGSDIKLEGYLSNVMLNVYQGEKKLFSKNTNSKGEFSIQLSLGEQYELTYSKPDYEKSIIKIDLTQAKDLGKDLNFKSLELILNSFFQAKSESDIVSFATVRYDAEQLKLVLVPAESSGGILKKKIDYGPAISLIEQSIIKNEPYLLKSKSSQNGILNNDLVEKVDSTIVSEVDTLEGEGVSLNLLERVKEGNYLLNTDLYEEKSLAEKKDLLNKAKGQLALDWQNAQTAMDTLYLLEREALIASMESDLEKAESIIALKEKEINQKSKIVWLFVFLFLVALAGVGVYFWMWRDKKIINGVLVNKDRKIQESLSYAQKIQEAVLPTSFEFSQLLPNSFILYWPKDVVSGDFYWAKEVGDKTVVASVDCTGHGVPGAFMSMIGNTLMTQIIVEEGVSSPKKILGRLDEEIKSALKQDDSDPFGNQDGMDMSICVIDQKSRKMTYAGAMNPIYRVSKNRVEILDVSKIGVGGMKFGNAEYEENEVDLDKGESIYMLSDGYMDQFGGGIDEKFNLPRFKSLLAKVHDQSMKDQKHSFENTILEWRGDNEQTDDILVIGIKLD